MESGVLTVHLELTSEGWYPQADGGPSMHVDAWAEEWKAPQVPWPLIRVPQGIEIYVTFHNLLPATAVIHGMHQHPGDAKYLMQAPGPLANREV